MKLMVLAHFVLALTFALPAWSSPAVKLVQGNPQSAELDEASQLTSQVVKLFAEGKFDEAYAPAKRALELREKHLGKDDQLVNNALLNLAEVLYARGTMEESKNLFERLLHSYQRTLGPDDPRLVPVLERLALNYYALGQPDETEKAYKQSLQIREKALGEKHPDTAQALYDLAEFYQFEGEFKKAEPLYQKLIEIRTANASSGNVAEALDRYACVLRKEKRVSEAEQIEERMYGVRKPNGNPKDVISSGIVNGTALHLITPPYPAEARQIRASGKVTVRVLINEDGNVIRACAIEGPRVFMKVSEWAASRSKFSPTTFRGKPVNVNGSIVYNFAAR